MFEIFTNLSYIYKLVIIIVLMFIFALFYIFLALSTYKIYKKENLNNGFMCFIPLLNLYSLVYLGLKNKIISIISLIIIVLPLININIKNFNITLPIEMKIFMVAIFLLIILMSVIKIYKKYSEKYIILTIITILTIGLIVPFILFFISKNNKIIKEKIEVKTNEKSSENGFEILELAENNVENPINVNINKDNSEILDKKTLKLLIIIFSVLFVIVFTLPYVSKFIKNDNKFYFLNSNQKEKVNINNTVYDQFKIVGQDSNINISGFNFFKIEKNDNNLNFIFNRNTNTKKNDKLDLYIELFDKKKTFIMRYKFNLEDDIVKDKNYKYSILLDKYSFNDLYYIRIKKIINKIDAEMPVLSSSTSGEKYLTCIKKITKEGMIYNLQDIYYFNNDNLVKFIKNYELNNTIESLEIPNPNFNNEFRNIYNIERKLFKSKINHEYYSLPEEEAEDYLITKSILNFEYDYSKYNNLLDYKTDFKKDEKFSIIFSNRTKDGWVCK